MTKSSTKTTADDESAVAKHMRANRVLANKNAELEKELRLAMQFIGMVPHHVFKYPKEVVEFYERNAQYAPSVQS